MTRQQFLAEFNQYLTFFTPQEQAAILKDITDKFDAVGESGESEVIAELGTPMKLVINLKRRKEKGENLAVNADSTVKSGGAEDYSVETDTFDSVSSSDGDDDALLSDELNIFESDGPVSRRKHKKSVPGIIFATIFSLVFAVIFLAVAAAGAFAVTVSCSVLLAGLQSLHTLAVALMLFCGGFVCLALGLLIIWFAVWAAISLISGLYRSSGALGSATANGKKRMKSIWKVIALIFLFVCIAGAVCGAVAYFMGGSISDLSQNSYASVIIKALSPDNIINSINAFFSA